jgi:hypothetical protein
MSAAIGTLAVNVIANTGGFTKGIQQTRAQVSGFSSIATNATSSITGMVGGLVGVTSVAAAVTAAVSTLNTQVEELRTTMDMADEIGTSALALQQFQFAAATAGLEVSNATAAFSRMMKGIGQAAGIGDDAMSGIKDGLKGAGGDDIFRQIGLSAQVLKSQSPEQQLASIADAIASLKTNTEQVTAAQKIFGESGAKLLPMLREGRAGVEGLNNAFVKMGGGLSSGDVANFQNIDRQLALGGAAWDSSLKGVAGTWASIKGELADTFSYYTTGTTAISLQIEQMKQAKQLAGETAANQAKHAKALADEATQNGLAAEAKRAAEEMKSMTAEAQRIAEAVRTPLEVAAQGIGRAQILLDKGLLTTAQYAAQVAKLGEEYVKATDEAKGLKEIQKQQGVGAVTRGTTAGFSAALDGAREQAKQIAVQKQTAELQKGTNERLDKLIAATNEKSSGAGVILQEISTL